MDECGAYPWHWLRGHEVAAVWEDERERVSMRIEQERLGDEQEKQRWGSIGRGGQQARG